MRIRISVPVVFIVVSTSSLASGVLITGASYTPVPGPVALVVMWLPK